MIGRILGRLLNLPALLRYLREHRADRSVWDPAEDLELQLYGAIFGNNFLHYGYFREIPASADEISLADVSRAMDDYASLLVERVKPGERVLDVGCGMGGLLNRLDRAGAKPTGVTPNRAHAQHINKNQLAVLAVALLPAPPQRLGGGAAARAATAAAAAARPRLHRRATSALRALQRAHA